jgi:hypothetical protein
LSALLLFALGACQSEDEHPPAYVPPDLGQPISCVELRDAGSWPPPTDGGEPRCAASGLECALPYGSLCDAGQLAVARCVNEFWELDCVGAPDASP